MLKPLIPVGSLALVLLLSGCGDPTTTPSPPPSPSSTPVFASDEEALAAAEQAYAAYLAVSDAILADGGKDPDRIDPFVSDGYLEDALAGFDKYENGSLHTSGATAFDTVSLTNLTEDNLDLYLCLDVSQVRILNSAGTDITPANRTERLPLEVGFLLDASGLRLERSESWSGDDFC